MRKKIAQGFVSNEMCLFTDTAQLGACPSHKLTIHALTKTLRETPRPLFATICRVWLRAWFLLSGLHSGRITDTAHDRTCLLCKGSVLSLTETFRETVGLLRSARTGVWLA